MGGKAGCREVYQELPFVAKPEARFPRYAVWPFEAGAQGQQQHPGGGGGLTFAAVIPGLLGVFGFVFYFCGFLFVFTTYNKRISEEPKDDSLSISYVHADHIIKGFSELIQ